MTNPAEPKGNQDLIWDYYQNEVPEKFGGSRARLSFLADRIRAPASVLNIGCGTGVFEQLVSERGIDIYSLDPSERSVLQLRSRLGLGERAQVGYIQNMPFPNSKFDAVFVSEVLEHLTTEIMRQGLAEIHRVLKPGGRIIGTVPSRENLEEQRVLCPCCGKRFHRWGHEQSFDPQTMRAILSEHFEVTRVFERPFIAWRTLNWKGKVIATAQSVLWRLGSHGSNENVFFEANSRRG
jgi:SAM-dependent methyltransferase